VTSAAEEDAIELWNLVNGRDERWIVPGLGGGWMVTLEPTARAKRVMAELPAVLLDLEVQGRTDAARSQFGERRALGPAARAWSGGSSPGRH
jgi:hypothetical protein